MDLCWNRCETALCRCRTGWNELRIDPKTALKWFWNGPETGLKRAWNGSDIALKPSLLYWTVETNRTVIAMCCNCHFPQQGLTEGGTTWVPTLLYFGAFPHVPQPSAITSASRTFASLKHNTCRATSAVNRLNQRAEMPLESVKCLSQQRPTHLLNGCQALLFIQIVECQPCRASHALHFCPINRSVLRFDRVD